MWYLFIFFQIQCSVLSMFCRQFWCSIYNEQLVDESLGEAFLGGPQTPPSARRLSVFASFKKESSYGHVDICLY